MSLREDVQAVEEWYREQSGKEAPPSRVLAIMLAFEYLCGLDCGLFYHHEAKARLNMVELRVSTDPQWAERKNRAANEKMGVLVGKGKDQTESGKDRPEFWFLVPKGGAK